MTDPGPSLVIDASSTRIHLGVLSEDRWLSLLSSEREALDSIFSLAQQALLDSGVPLAEFQQLVYCEGPGSILSLRLAVMAINGWASFPQHKHWRFHTYKSLSLGRLLSPQQEQAPVGAVVSDFRRGFWTSSQDADLHEIKVITDEDLKSLHPDSTRYIAQRKQWARPPEGIETLDYRIEILADKDVRARLLREVPEVSVFMAAEPEFKRWDNERHRAGA